MVTPNSNRRSILGGLVHRFLVAGGSALLTATFFLVLPLIQAITAPDASVWDLTAAETTSLPPPPPPEIEEPEPDPPENDEPPPELELEPMRLDLSQLEQALAPTAGEGWGMESGIDLSRVIGGAEFKELLEASELDNQARAIHQVEPNLTSKIKRLGKATVYVIFIVDDKGRVRRPKIQSSPDPAYDKSALNAVKQWRFEPAQKDGQKVSSKVRVGIQFPDSE